MSDQARPARFLGPGLGGLAVAAAVGVAVGAPRSLQDLSCVLVATATLAALVHGFRLHRPRGVREWHLLIAGQSLWMAADLLARWQRDVMHHPAFPRLPAVAALLGYPVFALGLTLLGKERSRARRNWTPALDAVTLTIGFGLLAWTLLTWPLITGASGPGGPGAIALVRVALDLLLLCALVRLISMPGTSSTASRFLLAAVAFLVGSDSITFVASHLESSGPGPAEALRLISYAAMGAAALDPTMVRLSDRVVRPEVRNGAVRLVAVATATLVAPAVLAVAQLTRTAVNLWPAIVGSMVMVLLVVLRNHLAVAEVTSVNRSLEGLQDELAVQAAHDPLTGLANRTQSMRAVAGALGRARRRGARVAVLFLDLDGFKSVNDNYGHRAGDVVLREVATRMSEVIRQGDFVGRLGGDEFLVGIEDVESETDATTLANRLIAAIRLPIVIQDGISVQVGASVGIAVGKGGETDVESLVHEADQAVYHAKAAGRGRVELFDGEAREALRERNDIERALVVAISQDELVLHFQPIICLQTGEVESYEALVRWERPGVGLVPPDGFLPIAEKSDLICDLDAWVLWSAVQQLEEWNEVRGDHSLQIAVNISGRHISQYRIQDDIAAVLRNSTIIPPQLIIEVTETAPLDDEVAAANLEALREMGVFVSLDDFGTGYQSAATLSRLPIDILKIDRKFVDTDSDTSRSLLELMVKSAHAFGVRVVAEGVERADQLELVRSLGCEYVQGYYFGRPAPADALPDPALAQLLAG